MTDSVLVANLLGHYPDDVLALAAIIREVDGSNRMGAAGLAEAILSHPAWPALAEQFHPQEPAQLTPTSDTAPDPIAEVLPASGKDWAAVVRKAAQPDGHEARVMLEIQQRLIAVEGPVSKAEPEPEPEPEPLRESMATEGNMKLQLIHDLHHALDRFFDIEGKTLISGSRFSIARYLVLETKIGSLLLKALKQP
jgi:hypothetical protein